MWFNYQKLAVLLFAALLLLVCGQKNSTGPTQNPTDVPHAPRVTVIHPDGGQILAEEVNFTWSAVDEDPGETALLSVDLEYTDNDGVLWSVISAGETNDGSHTWDVSALLDGDQYLIRITVTDTTGLSGSDSSDDPFTIQNVGIPQVTVQFPNGGETVADSVVIAWSAVDPNPGQTELLAVDLEYSDDGGDMWENIAQAQANSGSHVWDIAQLPDGPDYLVRVTATDTTGQTGSDSSDAVFTVENTIYLVDRTGKHWDITHAVKYYGMDPQNFRYGLGPNAIQPINLPDMISPGEPGYPADGSTMRIIGTEINGDARAYPTGILSGHEVVNEFIGGEYAAVIY
jgi:hypothetical protein